MFDFDVNKTVDDLSGVPADFKDYYVQTSDGSGYALNEESVVVKNSVKVIKGLWQTIANQRKESEPLVKKQVAEILGGLTDLGDSPESILEAVDTRVADAKKGKSNKDVEAATDKLRKDLTDVFDAKENGWGDEKGGLVSQIRKLLVTNVINEALGDRAVSPSVARRVIADFVDIDTDEAGQFRTIVKDGKDARKNVTDGQLFTVESLIDELTGMDEYKSLFKSEAPHGSGPNPGDMRRVIRPTGAQGPTELSADAKLLQGLDARKATSGKMR